MNSTDQIVEEARRKEAPTPESSTQVPSMPPLDRSPPQIADYELVKRIGHGSYGEVWLARNILGTHHAVKMAL
jgi:hypothetical protein